MVKFITKTVCMAFIAALCVNGLSAQERINSNGFKGQPEFSVWATALSSLEKTQQPEPRTVAPSDVDRCDKIVHVPATPTREIWAMESFFNAPAGAHVAVATDGNHFYTATWNATISSFCRYNMDGSNPQTFTITGVAVIRSLTYDGTYFYGGHGGNSTIYKLDLANGTLAGTITSGAGNTRHLAYDPTLNSGAGGFWTGDWTTLAAISMTGTVLIPNSSTATVANVYGSAYDKVNHCLWLNTQENSGAWIQKYDIAPNTITPSVYDLNQDIPVPGIGGGAFSFERDGLLFLAANVQVSPNRITIYQLAVANNSVPAAPANFVITPSSGPQKARVLSWTNPTTTYGGTALTALTKAVIKRNGVTVHEITSGVTPGGNMTWTDNLTVGGEYKYSVYVVSSVGEGDRANGGISAGCPIIFEMSDGYGDGWEGSNIAITIDGVSSGAVTLGDGSYGTDTKLAFGGELKLTWVNAGGMYDDECSFVVKNGDGTVIYTSPYGMTPGVFYTGDFVCEGGGDNCPAVTNLQAEIQGTDVKLTWTAATGTPTGYKVYDGTTALATVTTTEYVATNLSAGSHTLAVEALYDDGCVPVKVTKTVEIKTANPIKNLNGSCTDGTVTLNWDAPDSKRGEYWLTYSSDNIDPQSGIGLTNGGNCMSAARFTPDDLAAKGVETGHTITKMSIAMTTATVTSPKLKIWEGGNSITNPGTLVVEQPINMSDIINNGWTTIDLTTPFEIDATKELRIGYDVTHAAGAFPFLYDEGPRVPGKSDLIFAGTWLTVYDALNPPKPDKNACIKAGITGDVNVVEVDHYDIYANDVKLGETKATTYTVTGMEGKKDYCVVAVYDNGAQSVKVCKEIDCGTPPPPCNKVTGAAAVVGCETATLTWTAVEGATGYKVDGVAVTTNEYTVTGEFEDGETYKWNIVTVCAGGESDPVEVSGVADCVGINEHAINVAIFPNPSNSTVTIQVANFAKVEVYNTIGQLVETRTISTVDVSTYNVGIYFFKVYDTNNNNVTKRVMVTK